MKKLVAACAFGLAVSSAFAAKTNTWTATSSAGNWSKASNWAEQVPLEDGDFVKIPANMKATMNDADFVGLPALTAVLLGATTSTMEFDVTGDHEVTWVVNGAGPYKSGGPYGTILKSGTGSVHLNATLTDNYGHHANIVINDGFLHVQRNTKPVNYFYRRVTVNKPGVLVTASGCSSAKFWINDGLYGDGTITNNESSTHLIYMGEKGEFTGELIGNIAIYTDVNQTSLENFRTARATSTSSHDLAGKSRIGLESIGGISADKSVTNFGSIGTGTIYFRQNPGIRYLGTGEVSHVAISASSTAESFTFDGGADGGLELAKSIYFDGAKGKVTRLNLEGTNRNVCTLSCTILDRADGTLGLAKRGSGTWKIAGTANAKFKGLVSVEEGTLQFGSLDERGQTCSLGLASLLAKDVSYSENLTDDMLVPYSWLLGKNATTGTLEYVGADAARCVTRPLAVRGTGRIASSGGALELAQASAAVAGTNTLVLAGETGTNVYRDLADGDTGVLAVVKEGAGTWQLSGDLTFSGGIDVKAGTVELVPSVQQTEYVYYRFNLKERYTKNTCSETFIDCGKLALFNDAKVMQNTNLVYNAARNGCPWALRPGECALQNTTPGFDYAKYTFDETYGKLVNLFGGIDRNSFARFSDSRYTGNADTKCAWPWLDQPDSWVRVIFRLPEGHDPIVSYELGSRWGRDLTNPKASDHESLFEVHSWSLEGSCDGLNWTELSSVVSNRPSGGTSSWWGNGMSYKSTPSVRSIDTTPAETAPDTVFPNGARIGVAPGATIRALEPVTVSGLTVSTAGLGTVDGFTFADEGTIAFSGTSAKLCAQKVSGTFVNCTGDLEGWAVIYNGKRDLKAAVTLAADGIQVFRPGALILVR